MSLSRDGDAIRILGHGRVEDAEGLTVLLQAAPNATLDLSACDSLHGAVVQAILAFRPKIVGLSDDPFMRDRLLPIFTQGQNLGRPEL